MPDLQENIYTTVIYLYLDAPKPFLFHSCITLSFFPCPITHTLVFLSRSVDAMLPSTDFTKKPETINNLRTTSLHQ